MKKTWYKSNIHFGTQPVRVLSRNILDWFENSYPNFKDEVRNEIEFNGLRKGIVYQYGKNRIKEIVYVDSNKTIVIEETFLSYLWIIGYVIFVNYDEIVSKPLIIGLLRPSKESIKYIKESEMLFDYGMSLIKSFREWDIENLPNPEYYDKIANRYIEKMNGVFLSAINFILIHEFAHVTLGHIDLDNDKSVLFSGEELKEQELSSDKYAITSLLESNYKKTNIHVIKGGILIGLLSLCLFDNTMNGASHPDPDDRVKIALELFKLEDVDNLWGVACMGFKQWSRYYKIDLDWPKNVGTPKELFYFTHDKLKSIKFER